MIDISNVVFEFLREKEQSASEPLFGAEILPSWQHPVSKTRTVRVDSVSESRLVKTASGAIQRHDAQLALEILVKPSSTKLEHLTEAQEIATALTNQIFALIEDSFMSGERLGHPSVVCNGRTLIALNRQGNIGATKYKLSYLRLIFNEF